MKKIFTAIAILASMQLASAQQLKTIPAAKSSLAKAVEASNNPKSAEKAATWVKLGTSYFEAYLAPAGAGWIGATRAELGIVMTGEKAISSEEVTLPGNNVMTKEVYTSRNYYFNANDQLAIIEVTKPICEDALDKSLAAFSKGYKLGGKAKDIAPLVEKISQKFNEEAYNAYTFGDYQKASVYFEKAASASMAEPFCQLDTNAIYNAGQTAWMASDFPRAKSMFERCLRYNYYGEEGDVYGKLAEIADKTGDKKAQVAYLEDAFLMFPNSQAILVGLINYYVNSGENTDRLFELIDSAKKNEPNNASLYYVEGNILLKLGFEDRAVTSYETCAKINPDYEFGYIGEGQLFYNKAVAIQEQASNELDDNKYMQLVVEFERALKSCIPAFEGAFRTTKDSAIKLAVAEYLKNACFRFRTESEEFSAKYNKYNEYVTANK